MYTNQRKGWRAFKTRKTLSSTGSIHIQLNYSGEIIGGKMCYFVGVNLAKCVNNSSGANSVIFV